MSIYGPEGTPLTLILMVATTIVLWYLILTSGCQPDTPEDAHQYRRTETTLITPEEIVISR